MLPGATSDSELVIWPAQQRSLSLVTPSNS